MENVKPEITIAKYKDRIPFDGTVERAAELHGKGSVYVDGKCYAEILADAQANAPLGPPVGQGGPYLSDEAVAHDSRPELAAEGAGETNA